MAMDEILIRAHELGRAYPMGSGTVYALNGVDVQVPKGALVSIIGPSGSGKSTLLHLVGGLDRPTAGHIEVDGQRIDRLDENELASFRRSKVGFIFQSFNLVPSLSALANVGFPALFNGMPRRAREDRARQLLVEVGLAERMKHRPTEISGGQQQRVAIARSLMNDPEIILADEPTGNLDTQSGMQILELLSALNGRGKTILIVSHDPRVAGFATQVICLLDGKIVDLETYRQALVLAPEARVIQCIR
jgi:putative ABC transport system ATP-binding protein